MPKPAKRVKLAIDARNLVRDHRGLGRYARAVTRELLAAGDFDIVLMVRSFIPNLRMHALRNALGGGARFRVSHGVERDAAVSWHPWNGIFIQGDAPAVVTIADVAPFRYPASGAAQRTSQQQPFLDAAEKAAAVITISDSAARDITGFLGIDAARINVTYLGIDPVFTPGAPASVPTQLQNRDYFLFVGDTREVRKNFTTLHAAMMAAWPNGDGPLLAVAGTAGAQAEGTVQIERTEDAALRDLYRGAIATCVPALYEGFGMPVIESMACGTPVICSNASSLPEAAGEAAILLDPLDVTQWADALHRLTADQTLRAALCERGLTQAARFRWERCAQETAAVIRRTAGI